MTEDLSVLTRPASPPDQVLAYGADIDQVAELRFGGEGAVKLPLLVVVHGGFWRQQYDRKHAASMAAAFAALGWTVVTVEYRRIPGNPDASLQDVVRAVQVLPALPALIAQHNGKVIMIGHSAGGHLALYTAGKYLLPALHGVLALAPVADLRLAHALRLGNGAVRDFLGVEAIERPGADPKLLGTPPVLVTIVHGVEDAVVPQAISESYLAAYPKTRLVRLQGSGHFALIDPLSTAWPTVVAELQRLCEQ
ncbi:MAG: alpha/beta hydrolase [Collimonas sp.]|uniref:alpha/beta hydrolase n=1 Tax=Collimonas sp. TaxID=1963772 RepID=UPI0032653922